MNDELKKQIDLFREKTEQFVNGEINVAQYKGFSGKFGSYAQRGGGASMLRLRMAGGQLSKDKVKAIIDICEKYNLDRLHCTTCQTIQIHNIPPRIVADVMTDAIESGFYTLGGGGDFPRNVMVSPLTGVENGENFDVFPYAEKAAEYLLKQIDSVKMPRKLKVCFSNSPQNAVHATFCDLGFVSRPDGRFDVYCAGGMGMNPRMGVKVADGIDGSKVLYYIKTMIEFFCEYGNYEVRSKARTRYIQDTLGDSFIEKFNKILEKSLSEGGLDISVVNDEIKKTGVKTDLKSRRISEQKQDGLYTVKFHPIGGTMHVSELKRIYEAIKDMDGVSLRVSPDESIYIINCDGNETEKVLKATSGGAEKAVEESVACIGASICQQGMRDSQELLRSVLQAIKPYDFADGVLPVMHISGCMSSCGTHQIGSIGFHGKVKMVDKKPVAGFTVNINGCDKQGREKFGDELGVIAAEDIPVFITELGKTIAASGMNYEEFAENKYDELINIVNKYI
ncbi:MAG: nitrite/sulfite reductase [Oscillospiraceae bacterium]|nr:nitrite/sulfite reductase [Oscillospiraceae bacterium]